MSSTNMKKDQFGKLRTSKSPAGRYLLTESTGSKSEVESFKTKLDELAKRLSNTSNKREVDRNSSSEQSDVDLKSKIIKGERKSLEFLRAQTKSDSLESSHQSETLLRGSNDSSFEDKHPVIYGCESIKQFSTVTVQSNNELFSKIFLNTKDTKDTISTTNSIKPSLSSTRSHPRLHHPSNFETTLTVKDFQIGRRLGAGKFGEVLLARHRSTGFMCALKKIEKARISEQLLVQLVRQIKIQSFLSHPNIVKLYDFFSDVRHVYLMLELCSSGQLYALLKRKKKFSESLTRYIMQQICRALDYMHDNDIIHRDLKPQNVIYHNGLFKICDFGWSISTNTMRGTFCGTPLYISPQLLKQEEYDNKVDIWSVGILAYELLIGRVPFQITSNSDFIKIVEDQINFSTNSNISQQAKNFIMCCLQKDPNQRQSIARLLADPFLALVENAPAGDIY